jgi:hypothetical protein
MAFIPVTEGWRGPGARDGEIVVPPLSENGNHDAGLKGAFEHWYFDARLDNGYVIVGFLQTSELITKKPGVELHVYRPDGTRVEIRKPYPPAAARASTEFCDVTVGHNYARLDRSASADALPVYQVHLEEDGVRFDLTFRAAVDAWQPGHGRSTFGEKDFFAWVVPAPRANVSGTISVDGVQHEVTGVGYHDHNWGKGFMPRIVARWYWGRVYAEDLTLIYATIGLNPKRFGPDFWIKPLMLAIGDKVVVSTGEVTMTEGPRRYHAEADNAFPEFLELTSDTVSLRLDVQNVIHAHSFLHDVPVLGKPRVAPIVKPLLNAVVGHPGYFRFNSTFRITAEIDGATYEREGTTLHEMVALR